jgi:hypothetical protein
MNYTTGKNYWEGNEMLTLFNGYRSEGKISEALLVGQNLFNRNPANSEVFSAYFDFLCSLAENLPLLEDRQDFANRAAVALAFFAENADLDAPLIAKITAQQERLSAASNHIATALSEKTTAAIKECEQRNAACLKEIYKHKDRLQNADTQELLDAALAEIGSADAQIDKNNLTAEQNTAYDTLTKELTDLISVKMRELEYKKNVAYNKQAADSFAQAFKKFRENESTYKNQTQLFKLAAGMLFAYDASRLFNETLIYYNHVYSYIFSKLDDDGKLALTRYSIECERKLR